MQYLAYIYGILMDKLELGKIIKERRKFLGITQKDLAEISEIGLRSCIDIENGKGNSTFNQLKKILDALGLKFEIKTR